LGNTEYRLGGTDFFDISAFVRSVSIKRGKNRDLDRYSSGTLNVSLNNQTRFFDPFEATDIDPLPRIPVRVRYDGADQYNGIVEDWNYSYDPGGVSYASITAVDDMAKLARRNILTEGTATAQLSGARVEEVLDMFTVNWPEDQRDIDLGDSFLCSGPFDGENALEYLQLIETSEQGQLFIGKDGKLVFRSRSDSAPRSAGLVTFADDGSAIGYNQVRVNYGTELMVNRATVNGPLGTAVADNSLSQVTYGVIAENIDVLCASQVTLQGLANYTVAKYANPEYRFESLVVDLKMLEPGDATTVLGLELGDVVLVKFTPNEIGSAVEQYAQIIGLSQSIGVDTHEITFQLSSLQFTSLVLGDPEFGIIGKYTLGF
jgi:hypothetical protein